MPDDTTIGSTPDSARINLSQGHEMRYWTKTLGVSEDELRAAVEQVGSSVDRSSATLRKAVTPSSRTR